MLMSPICPHNLKGQEIQTCSFCSMQEAAEKPKAQKMRIFAWKIPLFKASKISMDLDISGHRFFNELPAMHL